MNERKIKRKYKIHKEKTIKIITKILDGIVSCIGLYVRRRRIVGGNI